MNNKTITGAVVAASFILAAQFSSLAQDALAAATKKIFNEHKDSVVWASAVAKINFTTDDAKGLPFNAPEREQKFEALGTIIDTNGLVVAALSNLDPSKEISGREINTPSGRIKIDAAITLKEVKIIMPDGTEIPADVIMKDADLDLAFLKPKPDAKEAKGVAFKAVDLKNSATGNIADEVVTVSRMDEVLNRQPGAQRGQIVGVTQKPRAFLRAVGMDHGCPTFSIEGKLVGITVNHHSKDKPPGAVILPAADVLEIAEQAKNAKPMSTEEPKAKEPEKPAAAKAPTEK